MSSSKIIVVNQFTFCFEHGNELCFACNRDYRSTNNSNSRLRQRLSEKLGHTFEVVYGFDLEERQSINVYAFGVTKATHHRGPRASGSCPDHSKVDCGSVSIGSGWLGRRSRRTISTAFVPGLFATTTASPRR
ncbi:hypothetical protein LshimejAT787_1700210 [Lyophyllum shimeji]|uniref:Uncharacterized protein n=1 Tax=Lyophyllum shimeji TaxID=47721 RepID=A0A9P3UQV8_LYOSH|nr:hypothetical protein LshimejAT787_1700210 [Lyophyllum shimeji]